MKQIHSFFLAGIIQGSNTGKVLHSQDYRDRIKSILRKHFPDAKIFDPVEKHPDSVNYDYRTAESVFMGYIKLATDCDCMIAYLPQASGNCGGNVGVLQEGGAGLDHKPA
jgi:hypothetical protein